MGQLEIQLEASTEEDLATLRADIAALIARLAPAATIELHGIEATQGAARNFFNSALWVTIVAPILTGAIVVGIEEAYRARQEDDCVIESIEHGVSIKTRTGEIIVIAPPAASAP